MDTIGTKAALLARADAYAEAAGLARSTVSLRLFNDGKTLDRIAAGGDTRTAALEKAWANLDRLEKAHRAKSAAPKRKRA